MTHIALARQARLPDDLRVARARSVPHLGPRILFFSGGSALNGVSRALKAYTFNSIHLITPFDSGGSSQILREAFNMPAVGDVRSRLMALADETDLGQPDIYALFTHRFSASASQSDLREALGAMIAGEHALVKAISQPMRQLIQGFLRRFREEAPEGFDFHNASVGNLILAGGYLSHERALEPVLFLMSKMVDVRGTVRTVVDANLHLGAQLADGRMVMGQKEMTGKQTAPLSSPVARLFLHDGARELAPAQVPLPKRNRKLIARADLICYSPGSLYSSVIANLLPAGVGRTIAARQVPKIYVPSLGHDPEALGLSLADQVSALLAPLLGDAPAGTCPQDVLTHVLCDTSVDPQCCGEVQERFAIACHRLPLVEAKPHSYDAARLCETLVSMV